MKYGIDVSTWQEGLDFERARILGYDFCICRIGYTCYIGYSGSGYNLDDLFVHNINEAKANGMELGVYYYYQYYYKSSSYKIHFTFVFKNH